MSKADFATKAKIANLLIKRVNLFPDKAIVEGFIPIDPDALNKSHRKVPIALPPLLRGVRPGNLPHKIMVK